MDSDYPLICRMKCGDEQAIDAFVRKHYPSILRYCHLHIHDPGYAEDMTQETFARFFHTLPQYRHYGKAINYLYVIAANLCRDYYRKRAEIPMDILPEQEVMETEQLDRRMDVRRALDALPPELRETAILFFLLEVKQKEIAKILNISLPLVKYRIRRARELLTCLLGKEVPHETQI